MSLIYNGTTIKKVIFNGTQIKKLYFGNTLVFSVGLPAVLFKGSIEDPSTGGFLYDNIAYEHNTFGNGEAWIWRSANPSIHNKTNVGHSIEFVPVASLGDRYGGSIVTKNIMEFGDAKRITLTGSKTRNGYFVTGNQSNGDYGAISIFILDKSKEVAAINHVKIPAGWNNFNDASVSLSIPASITSGYIGASAYTSNKDSLVITLKQITAE